MQLIERIRRDWHAEPEYKCRAAVSARGDRLGLLDAAGPTEGIWPVYGEMWSAAEAE